MMKKILVQGYMNLNVGDDLFFKILTERYRDVEWYFLDINEETLAPIKNTNIHAISNGEFLRTFNKYDALVNIGGSIFIKQKKWVLQYLKRLFYMLPLKLFNKKVIVMGSNFGPYDGKLFRNLYSLYFRCIDSISFRDTKSFNLFKNNSKVIRANDIVFSLKKTPSGSKVDEKTIGISLMDFSWREGLKQHNKAYLYSMEKLSDELLKRGYSIKYFSFCKNEGDERVSKYLMEKFETKKVSDINYTGDIDVFLREFSSVSAHIGLRFHSVILAILYKIPLFPIIYSQKTLDTLKDIDLDKNHIEIKNIDKLTIDDITDCINRTAANIDSIIDDSKNHFNFLDKLLGEDTFEK